MYVNNEEQSEEKADYFLITYFKSLPARITNEFRESIPIFAGDLDIEKTYKELGLKKWESPQYKIMESMCKIAHPLGKYKFSSFLTNYIT